MDIRCSQEEKFLINKIANAAQEAGMPAYLVGGFVRDRLIDRPCADLDVVCLGDGIDLAHRVAERFKPVPPVSFFKTFGTAHIRVRECDIEFVGARKESYRKESRNPEVEPGTLTEDMERRDFTINAMSIGLNIDDFGKLYDPFNGAQDLNDGIIRTP